MNTKKLPLAFWIFVGLVVGIVAGLALMAIPGGVDFAKTYVKPFGTIFLCWSLQEIHIKTIRCEE